MFIHHVVYFYLHFMFLISLARVLPISLFKEPALYFINLLPFIDIIEVLSVLLHRYGISLHLFRYLISLGNILHFSVYKSCIFLHSWSGKFIFQCHIFLPFHTVHGVLKARILKWFAIPFSSGPHSVRCIHWNTSSLEYGMKQGKG